MTTPKPKDIDEYIAGFPPETKRILEKFGQQLKTLFLMLKKQSAMESLLSIGTEHTSFTLQPTKNILDFTLFQVQLIK